MKLYHHTEKPLKITFFFMVVIFSVAPAWAGGIELITHSSNTATQLEQRDVRAIFSMRLKTWPDNQPIHVFVLEQNNPVHEQFCKDILKIFPYQLQAGWDRLVFSGTGEAPKIFSSEQKMIEAISNTPGSIGYILKQEIQHENSNIHSITVQ